ncbi:MAG: hypothetical protein ACXQTJ_01130 [Candidatus Syntropharchaeales archaeon]
MGNEKFWEYHITRDRIELKEPIIECDMKGVCLLHEPVEEEVIKVLNREGDDGWELVELAYHQGELVCVWKKPKEVII